MQKGKEKDEVHKTHIGKSVDQRIYYAFQLSTQAKR